ncbi:sulfotransferase family 2 domain-containing protein [Rhodopirellula baltica]|uniref:sulfotransferase family 2 domain-containing protein n=1 Tax=Rhodopirellula baltica TaxID=265606 RepID=UPI001F2819DE|nr:sulfotransferase family 2 domain-containing protein [Rhodopirellula baltica]
MVRNKCVFVHVPKAAGTAIIAALNGGQRAPRDHCTWRHYRTANRRLYEKSFKFAFVRNPWDRVFSTYTYLIRGGNMKEGRSIADVLQVHAPTFEAFVMDFLSPQRLHQHPLFAPQTYFICNYRMEIQMDFVGKLESIDTDFSRVQESLPKPVESLQVQNTSRERLHDFREEYKSPAVIDRVAELYRGDIEAFGYAFGDVAGISNPSGGCGQKSC